MTPSRRGQGSIYTRPESSSLWVCYYVRGKRHREPAMVLSPDQPPRPATTEPEARRFLKERLKQIAAGTFAGPAEERVTVSDLLDDLMTYLNNKGAKSVVSFESHIKPVRAFFSLRRAVEVTTAMVEEYVAERLAQGKARATVNRETGALRQAFNLAAKRKPAKLTRAPFIPMLNEDNARQGFFEGDEFASVVANLPAPVDDIALFAYLSGWRKGEILSLRWDAVDRQGREIKLRTSKSGRPRTLPLEGELADLVLEKRWRAREFAREDGTTALSEFVFHAGDGRAVVDFKRSWATACDKVGLAKRVTDAEGKVIKVVPLRIFHDLRRTAVRDMIRAGVPQSVAMRISGHKTGAIFTRYDITSEADKREALRRTQEHRAAQPNAAAKLLSGSFGPRDK